MLLIKNASFTVQPAISPTGNLTFTPAASANGSATVTVTLVDNGSGAPPNVNSSVPQNFTITVNAINDPPSFTPGANQTVNEDAGPQTVAGWATAIDDGDPGVTQTLTFIVSNNNTGLFSVQPSVSALGGLSYTPAANANGSATVTVTLSDDGAGSPPPNDNTSAPQNFTITINAVNDVPTFSKGADQAANENAIPQLVAGWATGIDDGDPELSQTLTFTVTNDNNSLFSSQPAINAAGNLTYTPALDANGSATVSVRLSDNGSGVAPNVNMTAIQTFMITVNNKITFHALPGGSNQTVDEDAGPQTVTNWATAISDGDPELTQTLTFNVSNDNNVLFSAQPTINASGTLSYNPAANANGSATVTVVLSDNGAGSPRRMRTQVHLKYSRSP